MGRDISPVVDVVVVINEGDSVALRCPGHVSQVLILVQLVFLKYQRYTHGDPGTSLSCLTTEFGFNETSWLV